MFERVALPITSRVEYKRSTVQGLHLQTDVLKRRRRVKNLSKCSIRLENIVIFLSSSTSHTILCNIQLLKPPSIFFYLVVIIRQI